MREPTPVEVWGPPFRWLGELTISNTQEGFRSGVRCKLCENLVTGDRKAHVKQHARERAAWQKRRASDVRREAKQRIALVNRERRLTERVLSERGGGRPPEEEEADLETGSSDLAQELEGWADDYLTTTGGRT